MRQPSKLVSGVQFSGEALKRCKHYGDAAGSYPAERGSIPWRRTGVYANAERPSSKGGGCEFESRRAYSMGYGGTGRPARPWTGSFSRFEAWYPSSAAAHGCGPAPVKRAVRIGTGRRLAMGGSSMAEQRPLMPEVPGPNPGRPAHACLVATVSMPPRYGGGRGSIPRAGSADGFRRPLHVTVVLAVQHASSPSSQGRFESGRSLAVLAQLVEAQVLGIWRSGFESPGRYSWRANRTGTGRRC